MQMRATKRRGTGRDFRSSRRASFSGQSCCTCDSVKKRPLSELIMPKNKRISNKKINLSESLMRRSRNKGRGNFSDVASGGELSLEMLADYLAEHFSKATDEEGEGALDYELEYICIGKESDKKNLEKIAEKVVAVRYAVNYQFLQSSASKYAEAAELALALCTQTELPGLEQATAQAILTVWAFGESIVDMRALLNGSRVPAKKSEESWQLSISGFMKLGMGSDVNDGRDCEGGLSYEDYLGMILISEEKEKVSMRALDMIEQNLRKVHGAKFFRADYLYQ